MGGEEIVECVPNFSEGRDAAVIDSIANAIASVPRIAVLHQTMDADHNRSVITFAGSRDSIVEAAIRGVEKAVSLIDLTIHQGVHPRIGAADVVPFVPVRGVTLEDCVGLAEMAGEEIWRRLHVPVYLYEGAARLLERRRLENVRKQDRGAPDIGGPQFHPTAGAAAVGARKFLIAWNVNLATADVGIAKAIARRIRASSGGFPHVKALGLMLASRNQTQVSMNLTDFEITSLRVVFDEIERLAEAAGTSINVSELIGLIPQAALASASPGYLRMEGFDGNRVLENRLASMLALE
ncbi:MAG: glutamate formimidoyltransferase [Bryobacteraceae bacterium]